MYELRFMEEVISTKGRFISMLLRLMSLALIAGALYISTEGIFIILLLFVLVVPFEKLFPRHKGQKIRRPHLDTDLGYALAAPLLGLITGAVTIFVAIVSLAWIPGLLLKPYVAMIPSQYIPIIGFFLFDFLVYWTHRFYHEIPVLWKFHAIHHSTEHLDWASGFRAHPLDGTILAPAFIFLITAGFSLEITGALAAAQIILGLFLHANVRWNLKLLHRIIITPEFHHWHHTNEKDAIWTNYSTFLPLWDQIFGTYFMPKDRRPIRYGVNEKVPEGIILQLKYPFQGWKNPLWYLLHPIRSAKRLFGFAWLIVTSMLKSAFRKRGTKPWDLYVD
ncbi:MAG: hypothetical protein CMA27_02595 [Euryarchaeota archaeon]|nr:hypothetical protein [Euryarchaeota archaeon]|tara:strand:- start:4989 stop:5990 length:1002 start_codon:yes stop_codon:yes gene_type:complete